MRLLFFGLAFLFVSSSCGDGTPNDCACTVTIGADTLNLGCGESGCVGGYGFGCDNDEVQPLGRCNRDDGGACVPAGAVCDETSTCCSMGDGGSVTPSCDPTSHRCCAAAGTSCSTSADCCSGHVCENTASGLRCSN